MTLNITPTILNFNTKNGNKEIKSVLLDSEGHLFNGFDTEAGAPFSYTPISKHLNNGYSFEDGVTYYIDSVTGELTTEVNPIIIGVGNSVGGMVLHNGNVIIDSINGGLPLTYEGLFEDGMWYFADTTGTKVVDQNDPDRSEWFIGTGTADGDIDLDIKMLAITDVVIPETVQLGVAFDVSGNYVMLEPRIVIEAFDGVTWKKIHAGDYIEVADGSFTESVTIESAYGFIPNTSVTIRVRSYDGYALNGSDSTDVIATVTMNAISGVVDGTPYTLEGTTDGDTVEIWVDDGTGYAKEGDAVVVGSAWSYDITLAVGTYDIKAIDGTDSRGYAEQTGVVVEGDLDFLVISAGSNHSLGIWDGKVYAWGYNDYGQLGDGSTTQRYKPVAVAVDTSLAGKTVVGISAGKSFSLAVCDDGTVHAWGYNGDGQLGDGSTTQRYKPVAVAVDTSLAGKTVVGISAGGRFSLAVCSDGTAHAWGYNIVGQLGDGSITQRNKPVAVAVDTSLINKKVVMVSASVQSHSLALCDDGTVHGWGYNNVGQLGDGSKNNRYKPVAVAVDTSLAGKFVTYVSAGCYSSHCVCDDGTAHGWGDNTGGQLGDNSTTKRSKPVAVNTGTSLAGKTVINLCSGKSTDFGYGDYGWCVAVCADGTVHAWGSNGYGQLGDGSTTQRNEPVAMAVDTSLAGKTATQVSSGLYFTLIKCNDGTAHAVGYNCHGQLGDNSTTNRTKTVLVDTSGI